MNGGSRRPVPEGEPEIWRNRLPHPKIGSMSTRRIRWLALALVAVLAPPLRAQDPALQAAVRSFDPAASLDAGRVRVADFNGDGLDDVSAVLVAPERHALVAFHALAEGGYVAYPLYAVLPQGDAVLRIIPPGRVRVLGPQGAIDLAASGLELVFPGKSSALYVWRDGRYQVYGTENH
jgi:hypothetical protein